MTLVADYVIQRLHKLGVSHCFGVYGAANGPLVDAFHRSEMQYVAMQHEQQAGFAAEGYAKAKGDRQSFGLALATSGPGGQNFATPIANCYYDSVPVLFLTGNIVSAWGKPKGSRLRQVGFQECSPVDNFQRLLKFGMKVTKAEDIGWAITTAVEAMTSGRPGPALLDIPLDIQKTDILQDQLQLEMLRHVNFIDGKDLLAYAESCVAALRRSARPGLLVGGGCRRTGIASFAADLGIPVFTTWNAIDLIEHKHPLLGGRVGTYGGRGYNKAIQEADFLLTLGCRLSGRITGGSLASFAPRARREAQGQGIWAIDIDPAVVGEYPVDAQVFCADAGAAIGALRHAIGKHDAPDWLPWIHRVRDAFHTLDPVKREYYSEHRFAHPYVFARDLGNSLREGDVLVHDCGGNAVIVGHVLDCHGARVFSNHGNSPMGFSVSAGVGALFGGGGRGRTVVVVGDGGLMLNLSVLETVGHHKLPLKIFCIDNGVYGITEAYQRTNFAGRLIGCGSGMGDAKGYDYSRTNLVDIAKCFKIRYVEMSNTAEINTKKQEALAGDDPVLCRVACEGFTDYRPRISRGDLPIDQMEV